MTQPATNSGTYNNCKTNPPREFDAVLRALKKDSRRRPFSGHGEVQGSIARLKTYSGERNAARNLRVFLLNYGVLVKDDAGKIYLDSRQGEVVLECCAQGREAPLPEESLDDRLARLRAEYAPDPVSDIGPESPPSVDPLDEMSEDELEALTRPDPAPAEPAPARVEEAVHAVHVPKRVVVHAPVPEPAPAPSPAQKVSRIPRPVPSIIPVMYLTPTEAAIWAEVAQRARCYSSTSWRLGIPKDSPTLYARWRPEGLECDEDELYAAFQRFVDKGVLKHLGQTQGQQSSYTLCLDPDWTQVRAIEARHDHVLSAEDIRLVRIAQSGERPSGFGRSLAEQLEIVGIDTNTRRPWRCVKGFEKFELVLPEPPAPAPQPITTRSAPAPTPPRPAAPASTPIAPPTPPSADAVRELTERRDELQARIEQAQRDIAGWSVQRAQLDAELKLHQDAIRQEALKRKAALAAQQEELAAQQAAIDRELAALGKP